VLRLALIGNAGPCRRARQGLHRWMRRGPAGTEVLPKDLRMDNARSDVPVSGYCRQRIAESLGGQAGHLERDEIRFGHIPRW
jgi:hypothetical protein